MKEIPYALTIFRSRFYPALLRWPVLLGFTFILPTLLLGPQDKHLNLALVTVWFLWWPLFTILFLFVGRLWCAFCPFAMVGELLQKFTCQKMPTPRIFKKYGIWVGGSLILFIIWIEKTFFLHHSPYLTAILLCGIQFAVCVTYVLYKKRTWCRYICPLGEIGRIYVKIGMIQLNATPRKCKLCRAVACLNGSINDKGCPMSQSAPNLKSSADCIYCGLCVKNCPNDSIRINLRIPSQELWGFIKPQLDESVIVSCLLGILTIIGFAEANHSWFFTAVGSHQYVIFTALYLLAMVVSVALIALASRWASTFNDSPAILNFSTFNYTLVPLLLSIHIGRNLSDLYTGGHELLFLLTERIFHLGHQPVPPLAADSPLITVLQFIFLIIGFFLSIHAASYILKTSIKSEKRRDSVLPPAIVPFVTIFFFITVLHGTLFLSPHAELFPYAALFCLSVVLWSCLFIRGYISNEANKTPATARPVFCRMDGELVLKRVKVHAYSD